MAEINQTEKVELLTDIKFRSDPFKKSLPSSVTRNTFDKKIITRQIEMRLMLLCDGGPKQEKVAANAAYLKKRKENSLDIYIQDNEYAQILASAIHEKYGTSTGGNITCTRKHETINDKSYNAVINLSGKKLIVDFFAHECVPHDIMSVRHMLRHVTLMNDKEESDRKEYMQLIKSAENKIKNASNENEEKVIIGCQIL